MSPAEKKPVKVGRRTLQVSNYDKTLFPDAGITKGNLIEYYEQVAPLMLAGLRDRPVALKRFPDGIAKGGFYQKDASAHFPEWVETVTVQKEGGTLNQVLCNDAASLVYLAGQAAIEFHVWTSRADRILEPDQIVFDFDPPEDVSFPDVKKAASEMKALLEEVGLAAFLKTTGSRGLHVVTPIRREHEFEEVLRFARDLAGVLAAKHPDKLTVEVRKAKRKARIFIDVGRNAYAQHAVAAYSVRALPSAPVSMPLDWSELSGSKLRPDLFTVSNAVKRMESDPWKGWRRMARSLPVNTGRGN